MSCFTLDLEERQSALPGEAYNLTLIACVILMQGSKQLSGIYLPQYLTVLRLHGTEGAYPPVSDCNSRNHCTLHICFAWLLQPAKDTAVPFEFGGKAVLAFCRDCSTLLSIWWPCKSSKTFGVVCERTDRNLCDQLCTWQVRRGC
jgi:hypothetical protein